MTTTPAAGPGAPAGSQPKPRLSSLLKRPVTDRRGESLGRLADVIVRLRGTDYPLVTGLVAAVGGRDVFVPVDQVSSFDTGLDTGLEAGPLRLSSARLSLRRFERRDGEVLLRADVLGHRLIDVRNARLVRAADLEMARITDLEPPRAAGLEPSRAAGLEPARAAGLEPPHAAGPEPPRPEWVLAGVDTRRRPHRFGRPLAPGAADAGT